MPDGVATAAPAPIVLDAIGKRYETTSETQACIFGDAGSVLEAQGVGRILMRLDEVTPSGSA
jgi:hypothetical protein